MSEGELKEKLSSLAKGIPLDPLPAAPDRDDTVPHAPRRIMNLTTDQQELAVRNALRYFPESLHEVLAPEFAEELQVHGHIYMYRFRPTHFVMRAYPEHLYPCKTAAGRCILHMVMNNLDPAVAQFPHELITYGTNGQVLGNWAQFHLLARYLCEMSDEQTLSVSSGHASGLFPSPESAPRMILSTGMLIPNYSSKADFERMRALGVTTYGQMTAGSFCYIGPQGIVHGTCLTVLNAGRRYLGTSNMAGRVFVTSGLGGMSGAQGKAGRIAGAVSVIAEVNRTALDKRHAQGWVDEVHTSPADVIKAVRKYREERRAIAIAFHGNAVELLEAFAADAEATGELVAEILSDQTSCHDIEGGGYIPVGMSYAEASQLLSRDREAFMTAVRASLRRHAEAINKLSARGAKFFDYGNAFLLEASRSGADIGDPERPGRFRYPSYVQDIMGEIFSLGFGPFRWVCASGKPEDLDATDRIAADIVRELRDAAPERISGQYADNLHWIESAKANALVVGSQARILYSDHEGRKRIALAFNDAVRRGEIGKVVLSRDHHDVSGTCSPFRETSSVYDGSSFTADMAVNNHTGLAARGATWVALHNGGGVGIGEVVNGGFGLVLDGSDRVDKLIPALFAWDVNNGIVRRAWAGSDNGNWAARRVNEDPDNGMTVTIAHIAKKDTVASAVAAAAAAAAVTKE